MLTDPCADGHQLHIGTLIIAEPPYTCRVTAAPKRLWGSHVEAHSWEDLA